MNDTNIGVPILDRPESEAGSLRMLVAIASYGEKNLCFLKEIIADYRKMALQVDIVVLTNAAKNLGPDVDVRVGLPARNPWSLPFAHKPIFAAGADRYDLFLYSEDDIRITGAHVRALLRVTRHLKSDDVAGYLRYESIARGPGGCPMPRRFNWKAVAPKGAPTSRRSKRPRCNCARANDAMPRRSKGPKRLNMCAKSTTIVKQVTQENDK